ncbi:MAG: EAL domain-containing protein [Pseudomonadales bacterium]
MRMTIHRRIFIGVIVVVVGFVLAVNVVIWQLFDDIAHREVLSSLKNSVRAYSRFEGRVRALLETEARAMTEMAHLKATLSIPDVDQETVYFATEALRSVASPDVLLVIDSSGQLLADASDVNATDHPFADREGVQQALQGQLHSGVWSNDNGVYQVAIAPSMINGHVLGAILVAYRMDDTASLQELEEVTGSYIQNVGSVNGHYRQHRLITLDSLSEANEIGRVGNVPLYEIAQPGSRWLTAVVGGTERGTSVAIYKELDSVVSSVDSIKIAVVLGSLIAALIGVLLGHRIAAQVSQPIKHLSSAASRYGKGDFQTRVAVASNDEVGVLTETFNLMADDLAASRENLVASKEAAEAASRAKSEFLATMSHEIRTPMNGVLGMTELLLASKLDKRQQHLANTAHRSAEGLLGVINDILDFSKIETGKLELDEEEFELLTLLEDTIDVFAEPAHRKHLELVSDLALDQSWIVRGDANRLRQVLINLLGNAIKFTDRGEVHLTQRVECNEAFDECVVKFEVSDTGVGIADEKLALIFEAFTQTDSSTSRKFDGSGLGLAICKRLVELMGGVLEVESEEGVGTCFRFTVRLAILASELQSPLDMQKLHGIRVISVDDHSTNREILQHQVAGWGMRSSGAKSAEEALERLRIAAREGDPFRVALLDWNMPGMTGDALAREILADPLIPDLPTIMLSSAYVAADSLTAAGITHYLTKPVRRTQLLERLRIALGVVTQELDLQTDAEQPPRFSASILLAEDNPVNQEVAMGILEMLGCAVTVAENGQQAVNLMSDSKFHLVLMDCHMPELDGFDATRAIRALEQSSGQRRIPIVALTADVRKDMRQRCKDAGMDDYLSKPFNQQQLCEVLAQWLPTEGPSASTVSSIEPSSIEQLKALSAASNKDILGNVIAAYCKHAAPLVVATRTAFSQRDWAALANAVHSLKSASANVGADRLTDLCANLEKEARAGKGNIELAQVDELERQLQETVNELQAIEGNTESHSGAVQTVSTVGYPRLLIIDDDPTFRLTIGEGLRVAGFDVSASGDGSNGLYKAEKHTPDLILLDAVMDGMDGFETCQRPKENPMLAQVPVVMITGLEDVTSVQRAFETGASGFTPKPVNMPILVEQIRFILRATDTAARLRENQAKLSSAQRMAKLAYWRWTVEADAFESSENLELICGMPANAFDTGIDSFVALLHAEDQQAVKNSIELALHTRESSTMEYRLLVDQDKEVLIRQEIEVDTDKFGQEIVFGTLQDITLLRATEDRIRKLAYYDPLTALASRSYLLQRIEETIKSARRRSEVFALMFMDLDAFKDINDSLGHDVGDQLLITVAGRLRDSLRETDFVARLGGDEFCVLLDSGSESYNIVHAAERCLSNIEQPVDLGSKSVRPRMSIGIANFPEDGDTTHSLLKAADSAMYAAKQKGKHRYEFYNREMTQLAEHRLSLATELRDAFRRKEYELHYQPLIDLQTGAVASMEALVRWRHPERGLIFPNDFLPELESIGLVQELGEYVLREACEQAAKWLRDGLPPISMSVNISPDHFRNPRLIDTVQHLLQQTALPPNGLLLEVTESVAQHHDDALATFEKLKDIGIKIAIDDFGTGYSSLGSLKYLPIDCLKIDRAFIRDMHINSKDSILLGTIFGLAHALNFSVVAEGVEELEQIHVLHSLGCDWLQGYYFSKPVPADEAGELITKSFLPVTISAGPQVRQIR